LGGDAFIHIPTTIRSEERAGKRAYVSANEPATVTAYEGNTMYAVIRTGGKQYRVAPGDVLKVEKLAHTDGAVEFSDVLAVSGDAGSFEQKLEGAKVTGTVVGEGRGEKILVFKFKRKKQYKRMQGHRQAFTEIKIGEISVGGKSFKA
jgi:large subunit ribosomal protein L21